MSKQIHREGQRKKQVKIRVDADLVDEFDEWCSGKDMSRSEALRTHMRVCVADTAEWDTPLEPPTDDDRLERAYRRLCAIANDDGVLREKTATSILASVLGISKGETKPMVLKPLLKRGYLTSQSNVYGDTSIHVVGWTDV